MMLVQVKVEVFLLSSKYGGERKWGRLEEVARAKTINRESGKDYENVLALGSRHAWDKDARRGISLAWGLHY